MNIYYFWQTCGHSGSGQQAVIGRIAAVRSFGQYFRDLGVKELIITNSVSTTEMVDGMPMLVRREHVRWWKRNASGVMTPFMNRVYTPGSASDPFMVYPRRKPIFR